MNLTKYLLIVGLFSISFLFAQTMKPFVMANNTVSDYVVSIQTTKEALQQEGFEVVGEYEPVEKTTVLIITNNALKEMATKSKNGAFGVVQRVAIVYLDEKVEISYTNPSYFWNAYRMEGDIENISNALSKALGNGKQFGAKKGLSKQDLRKYHYMFGMPYFDDVNELATYDSYDQAIDTIEKGLTKEKGGVKKIYRVDIANENITLFGVSLTQGDGSDTNILAKIDKKPYSHAAHLSYELLVQNNKAIALPGKFRIAISWPSLTMMGSGSFMSIVNAPGSILDALEEVTSR